MLNFAASLKFQELDFILPIISVSSAKNNGRNKTIPWAKAWKIETETGILNALYSKVHCTRLRSIYIL